ncbi:uncharacterized protein LOC144022866 isoform X2 [Festucalex cinctus]
MSHYTAGCILYGEREKLPQQSLRKYIHAETSTVYLVDPERNASELTASQAAAKRIREYFLMRRNCHAKTEWLDVKWKGGVMSHPEQKDGSSCGVIVVKMAKLLLEAFPVIPVMEFCTSKRAMQKERRCLALDILEASVFDEQDCCAMCATFKPPGEGPIIQWVSNQNIYRHLELW